MSAPPWDAIQAEYGDTLARQRQHQKRPCANGCGRTTQSNLGVCWVCQPSLLDEPSAQVGPDDPWPDGFF